jgi:hypothetical protein
MHRQSDGGGAAASAAHRLCNGCTAPLRHIAACAASSRQRTARHSCTTSDALVNEQVHLLQLHTLTSKLKRISLEA